MALFSIMGDCSTLFFLSLASYHYFIIVSYVLSLTECVVGVCGVDALEIVAYSWCRRPCALKPFPVG